MLKRLLVVAAAASIALTMSYADQSNNKLVIPVTKTNPTDGRQMYTQLLRAVPRRGWPWKWPGCQLVEDAAHGPDRVGKGQSWQVP